MSLVMRSTMIAPARLMAPVRPMAMRPAQFRRVSVRATPAPATSSVEGAIHEAEDICASGKAQDCAVAWDTVEELSAAAEKKRKEAQYVDPLEKFCETAPEADECRVYED